MDIFDVDLFLSYSLYFFLGGGDMRCPREERERKKKKRQESGNEKIASCVHRAARLLDLEASSPYTPFLVRRERGGGISFMGGSSPSPFFLVLYVLHSTGIEKTVQWPRLISHPHSACAHGRHPPTPTLLKTPIFHPTPLTPFLPKGLVSLPRPLYLYALRYISY